MRKLCTEVFIKKSKKIHGDKFDYSLVEYINTRTKINIKCNQCGNIFKQRPDSHINQKQGCPKCSGRLVYGLSTFLKKSKKIHGDKFDYSSVNYIDSKTPVKIICRKHGMFSQAPHTHLSGVGCKKCSDMNKMMKLEVFISRSILKHQNKYDYSLVNFLGVMKKVKIICPKHGIFTQIPNSHLRGIGCPKCQESKGEKEITKILSDLGICYLSQFKFKDCKDKNKLPFDFYLPNHNLCIEFDGEQHFKSIEYFGGDEKFFETQKRDEIKNNFCKENNIDLLRISFSDEIVKKMDFLFNI